MAQRTKKSTNIYFAPEMLAAIEALAAANSRTLTDEVSHAVARHLRQPPTRRVVEETPAMAPDVFERPEKVDRRTKAGKAAARRAAR